MGTGPAVIQPYDPAWPLTASRLIDRLGEVAPAGWVIDHIGSTAVPGLAAKPIIDLQIRVPALPDAAWLDELLGSVGYAPAQGGRPDSPGVHRDIPRGDEVVPADVWEKRLYVLADAQVRPRVIVHVRRADSPFGWYTVWFRDWLRANDHERARYESVKVHLAKAHAQDQDYDDYTRGKTVYLDEVQPAFESWVRLH